MSENVNQGQDPNEDQDEEGTDEGKGAGGSGDRKASAGAPPPDSPPKGNADGQAPDANGKPEENFDADYVKRLRAEAADNRKRAKAAEDKLKKLEEANLSELEKSQRRAQELEAENARLTHSARVAEIQAFVAGLGATHPEAVAKLADPEIADSKLAAAALKERYPDFFKPKGTAAPAPSADAGAGRGEPPKAGMNEFIRRAATGR